MFRDRGVERYAAVSEVWMAKIERPEHWEIQPRHRDERDEGIIVMVIDKAGSTLFEARLIERPWDGGKPTLKPYSAGSEDNFRGRMTELLKGVSYPQGEKREA